MADLTKEEILSQALSDYRFSLPKEEITSGFLDYLNKISEKDLEELKKVKKQKIVFTKPFAKFKVGEVSDVKVFRNTYQSEPPNFLVVEEKLGSPKYGFGGRGSSPFFEAYTGNVLKKYIFKEDYEAKGTNFINNEPNSPKMANFRLSYSFKKGDIFEGEKFIQSGGAEQDSTPRYGVKITTPDASKVDGTKFDGKSIFEVPEIAVTEQTLTTDASGKTFLQKNKTNLLIFGALVIGYLAYKKFNK
jgi:hypothetical protein